MENKNTTENKNKQLVVAFYEDVPKAKEAQKALETWDKANSDIKLGASAVIYKDAASGELKYDRGGSLSWQKGAGIGAVLMLITGGLALPFIGAGLGAFHTWKKGVKREDIERISTELDAGKSALAVFCDDYEVKDTSAELTRLGGRVITQAIPAQAVNEVQQSTQEAISTGQLTPDALKTPVAPPSAPSATDTTPTPPSV